ncbi:MAG: diaminopimelate decarboxylase, partial [Enterobacteriaceae bacterium]
MPQSVYDDSHALSVANLLPLPARFGTPLWVYDAQIIRERIAQLRPFDVIRFAQKACSNIHILQLIRQQGVKVDAVSYGEIKRALAAGYQGGEGRDDIVFTADVIDEATLQLVIEQQIAVNAGSPDMLTQIGQRCAGHPVWLRINPGFGHGHSLKTNTGGENSKHGIWHTQLREALALVKRYSLKLVGLHMHIGSGVDYQHLSQVCDAMVQQVQQAGVDLQAISAGGGLSTPYRADEEPVDIAHYYQLWHSARQRIEALLGHPVTLEIEPGRFLVAEAGVLLAEVRAVKMMGSRRYALVDAGFNDLMRPAMYGSYHQISVIARNGESVAGRPLQETVVGGPVCESGDLFTQLEGGSVASQRLPETVPGDYLLFHDTGAYGASMSSNYNSRPLLPEV